MSKVAEVMISTSGTMPGKTLRIDRNAPVKIKAVGGVHYVLKDVDADVSPENVTLERVGDDLQVALEGDPLPALTLEDYYALTEAAGIYGVSEDGELYRYVPTNASSDSAALPDGQMTAMALGGNPVSPAEAIDDKDVGDGSSEASEASEKSEKSEKGEKSEESDSDQPVPWWLWGFGGLAVAGGVIAAVAGGGGSSGSSSGGGGQKPTAAPPTNTQALDQVGDTRGVLANQSVSDDARPVISGTGIAGYTVTVYDGTQAIGTTTVAPDGSWSFQPPAPLSDGSHDINVTQQGPDTLPSAPVPVVSVVVDTVAPATPAAKVANAADGMTTNQPTPTIAGTGELGDTVAVTFPGGEVQRTTVAPDGTWSVTPQTALPDGPQSIVITEQDPAGNASTMTLPVVIDTAMPLTPAIVTVLDDVSNVTGSVTNGGETNDARPTISGTIDTTGGGLGGGVGVGNGVMVDIYDNGMKIGTVSADETGRWTFVPMTPLSDGLHSMTVTATDEVGNTSPPSGTFAFTVDTVVPAAPVVEDAIDNAGTDTGPVPAGGTTDDTTPTLNGTTEPGDIVDIYDNGTKIATVIADETGAWSFTPATPLAEGEHSLTVTTTDEAGNVSDPSAPVEFTVDAGLPPKPVIAGATDDVGSITGTISVDGVTDDTMPTLNGTTEPGDIIDVYDNGTKIGTVTADETGAWSFTPETPLADGEHSLTATTTDEAGNVSEPSAPLAITVDTTVPPTPAIAGATDDAGTIVGPIAVDGATDDATPTLNGTTEAGAIVDVYDNGTKIGTVTADDAGAWSFTPETPLADGEHSLTVTTTDPAGNVSEPSAPIAITVDTTVPPTPAIAGATDDAGTMTGSIPADGVTDDTTPTLNGTTEAGATVDVYDNGTKIGTVTADDAGAWSFTPETPLADGDHSLTVTTTDPAGNVSEPSAPIEITVDTTVPAPAIAGATDDAGAITGQIPADGLTDDTTPTLNGTTEAGATVDVYDNGTKIGTVTADETGAWSFTPETPLADGEHSLTVTTTDPVGNVSEPSAPIEITVDTTVPATPAIAGATDDAGAMTGSIPADGVTDDTTPTLNGTTEAGATVDVYDNGTKIGTVTADETGAWSFTPETPLADGDHSLTVTTTDAAGNVSDSSAAVAFTVDTTVPAAPVIGNVTDDVGITTGPVPADGVTDDATPTLNGTTEAGATVDVYDGTTKIGTVTADETGAWSFTPETPLSDGDHNLTVTTTDAAGNVSDPSAPVAFTVDTTTPTTPIIAGTTDDVGPITGQIPAGGATDDATPTLTGTTEAGATVDVYDSGTKIGTVTADDAGAWSFTPETPLADGDHSLTVTTTDAAGNVSDPSAPVAFTVDTTAPTTPIIAGATDDAGPITGQIPADGATDDTTPSLSGTTEPSNIVDVYDNGAKIGTVTADETGAWSFTPETPLAEGVHSLTVTTTDSTGNVSDPSDPVALTIDTTAPTTPVIAGATDDVGATTGQIPENGVTDDATPTITGTTEAGATVDVYDDGTKIGTVTADETGAWSFTPETPLADGDHSLTVTTADAAGNVSDPSAPVAFTVDTTAPTTPVIAGATDDAGPITGQIPADGATDDTTPSLSGTTEPGNIVDVYDNGAKIGTVTADETGAWSFTPETPLAEGDHSLTVTTTDSTGNVSDPSDPVAFTVDTTAPAAPVIAEATDDAGPITGQIPAGGVTDDATPTITGTTEAGATVDVYDSGTKIGTVTADDAGAWSFTPETPLADGDHSLTVTTTDAAGNVSDPSAPVAFTVDTTAPTTPVIAGATDDAGPITGQIPANGVTDDTTPTITGTTEAGATVDVFDDGTKIGTVTADETGAWSFTPETPLAEGDHSVTATATDAAGNVSEPSTPVAFTVDTTPPDVSQLAITGVLDDVGTVTGNVDNGLTTDDASPVIQGTGTAGDTVIVSVTDPGGAREIGRATVGEDGAWSLQPEVPLNTGSNSISAVEVDEAGNATSPSAAYVIVVDTAVPAAPVIASIEDDVGQFTGTVLRGGLTDDTLPTIGGTGDVGSTINVFDEDTLLGSTTVDENGNWTFIPATGLNDGAHVFTATATNPVGQTSEPSASWSVLVDTVAPGPITGLLAADDAGARTGVLVSGDVTDDTRPEFHGEAEPLTLVDVFDNGVQIGGAVVGAGGEWGWLPATPLTDGEHSFTFVVVDFAGNSSAASDPFDLIVDTTAPAAPTIGELLDNAGPLQGPVLSDGVTDDNTPTLSGTTEAGALVDIYDGGTKIGTVTADEIGAWSFTPETPLTDGDHSVTVTATDAAGNTGAPTAALTFTVDTAVLEGPATSEVIDDAGPDRGAIPEGSRTDDATPTFIGTTEPGATVDIYDDGEKIGTVTAADTGAWSFTPATPLADGEHSITMTTTDERGVVSDPTAPFLFVVDTIAPAVPVIDGLTDNVGPVRGPIADGSIIDDATPTSNGTAEPGTRIAIFDNGEQIGTVMADDAGNWSFTPETPLAEGPHSLTVTTTDEAGNTSEASAPLAFTLDTTAPAIPAIAGATDDVGATTGLVPAGGVTDDATPTLTGTTEAGATVELYDNGTKIGTVTADDTGAWSFTPETALAEGDHSLTVTTTDPAGNVSEPSAAIAFAIDVTVPESPAIDGLSDDVGATTGAIPSGGVTDDATPTLAGTTEAGATVDLYDNGTKIGTVTADEDGAWSFTPETPLADGDHSLTVTSTDAAGNTSEASSSLPFTVDTTAPAGVTGLTVTDDVGAAQGALSDGGVTDDSRPEFGGQAEAGSTVEVYDNGTLIGQVEVAEDGTWRLEPAEALADGAHAFTTVVVDAAGNRSEASAALNVTLDTSAVLVQIAEIVDDVGTITGNIVPEGMTDDATPQINGTGTSGSTITVYDGDTALGTTVVDANGAWSFTPPTALSEGVHSITATATDLNQNVSDPTPVFAFTVDTTAPVAPAIAGLGDDVGGEQGPVPAGGATDDTTPTLNGTTEAGATVDIYDNGEKIGTVTADENGAWSFTPETPLAEGDHSLTVTSTDVAGNTSEATAPLAFTVDTTVPSAPAISAVTDDVGATTGAILAAGVTDDASPTLTGTIEAGATVDIYDNDEKIGTVTADENGAWSFTPETPLADGDHSLTVTSTDAAGNTSEATAPLAFTVDTTVPATPVISGVTDDMGTTTGAVPAGGVTDDATPTLAGTTEAGARVDIYDGGEKIGTVTADDTGAWSFTPETALGEGDHSLTVTTTDPAGNVSEPSAAIAFAIDVTVPESPAIDGLSDDVGATTGAIPSGGVTDDATPTLAGTTEAGATVDLYDNGTKIGTVTADENGAWRFTPETPLADGDHSLTVTSTDAAGNTSEASSSLPFTVDTTVPAGVTGLTVADDVGAAQGALSDGGVTDDSRPEFGGQAEAGSTVEVYDNGTLIGQVEVAEDGTWRLEPAEALADGAHAFTTVVVDAAGNRSEASAALNVTLDTSAVLVQIADIVDDVGPTTGTIVPEGMTDDATPQINGTGTSGSTITVYDGDTALGTTVVDANGAWSFTPPTALSEGVHSITATATDLNQNVSDPTPVFALTVDTTAPVAPAIAGLGDDVGANQGPVPAGGATDDTTPTLNGTTEAGATVDIYDNDTKIGTVTADENGAWSFTPETPLTEGDHSLTVTSTDAAGNTSDPSAPLAFTVDTTVPAAPAISALTDDVGATTGAILAAGVTDDASPTLTGTTEAGATVDIYDNGEKIGTVIADEGGAWRFTPEVGLSDGEHSLVVTTTDGAGNMSDPSAPVAFSVDTTAPEVPSIPVLRDDVGAMTGAVVAGGATDDTTPTLSGTTEAGATVDLYDNDTKIGTVTADENGAWSFTPETPLSDGDHSLTVTSTDAAGNASAASVPLAFTVDTTVPSAPAISGLTDDVGATTGAIPSGGVTDDAMPTLAGTTEAGATVELYDNDTMIGTVTADENGAWSFTPETPLADGDHSLTVTSTDAAGNTSEASAPVTFTVDTSIPEAPAVGELSDDVGATTGAIPSGGVTDDATPTLAGTTEAGATVDLYDNDTKIGTVTADENGAWSFTPETPLADGDHSLTVTSTDAAGNTSEASSSLPFTVDTTAPAGVTGLTVADDVGAAQGALSDGGVTDDSRPEFGGQAEAGSTVEVYDNGTLIGQAEVAEDGTWRLEPAEALTDGAHAFTTVVVDAAGNRSEASAALNVTLDTSAVLVQIAEIVDDVGTITGNIVPEGMTDDATPQINGTGTSGSTITVYDGSTALGTTVVDANGAWSFTPPTALSEGVHSITATATDLNQNVSDPTPAFALTVDTTAPSMPTIDAISDDVGIVRGELAAGDATDDDRPALSGQAEAGAVVDIHDNGAKIGQAIADDNGIWSFTPAEPLAEGAHAFTVTAVDAAGNASAPSSQFAIVTDYTSPDGASLAITDVSDDVGRIVGSIVVGGVTDDDTPTIEGTAAAGSLVTIHVTDSAGARDIGTAMAGADGRWSMVPTVPLLPGENILSAVEMDAAGNASPHSPPYTIVIDKSAPMSTPAITGISDDTGGSDSDFVTTDRTLVIHGVLASALASGHAVEVSLDDGASWQMATVDADRLNWSFDNAASTLADGTYTVHARVVSAAGVNGEETAQAITVDNRGPTNLVTLDLAADSDTGVSSTDNRTSEITPTVQGQVASGSHALDALTITVFEDANGNNVMDGEDRVLAANIAVEADGNWSASIPSLPPGTYKLMASAVATSGAAGTVASLDGNDARLVIAVDEPQQIHGDTAGFQLGWDVTTAGDFNGDGIDDLLVTSQWADTPGRANSGASYILYGTPGGLPKIHTIGEVTPTTGLKILGSRAGDRMATAINPIGDFNGDGYDDVVLASHWQDKAYVIFGNQTNAWQAGTLDLNAIDAGDNTHGFVIRNPGSTATARGQDSWFGIGAGGGGDFDGDGYKDLLIGNRQAGDSARGEGFLLYGGAGDGTGTGWHNITMVWPAGETSTWQFPAGIRGTVISAPYAGTMGVANVQGVRSVDLGDCINTVGDVNGDGVDDFVISDPRAENVMSYGYGGSAGTAFLIYGRAGGLPSQIDLNTLAATDGIRIHAQHYEWLGSATANESGNAIQALGDINGDGVGDFALAASYSEPGDPGRVWVIYGKQGGYASDLYLDAYNTQNAQVGYRGTNFTSEHGFLIVNEKSSPPSGPGTTYQQNQQTQSSTLERFGSGIRALGDVNGDGIGDFVIGATNADRPGRGTGDDAGAAYVVYGREGGFDASVWSIKEVVDDPSKGLVYRGAFANALLGSGVTIGDWNGDGLSDVAVTADGDDANGTNAGVLNIYYYIPQFTQSFTAGDDVLTATSAKDLLVGGRGNDTIADIGAADYVNGGDGADTVRLASTNFLAVNGGTGVDTLVMDGHGATLDLKALGNRVTGFEIIDLGTNGGNALVVHEDDVKRMGGTDLVATDGNRQMVVRGDATDSVQLVSGAGTAWTDAGTKVVGGIGYHAYISGANEVLTDERVHVTLM